MTKKKAVKKTARKKVAPRKAYDFTTFFCDKQNWQMWIIVYGGIALILYGTLYFFILQK